MIDAGNLALFISLVVAFLMLDVFCSEPQNNRNPWQTSNIHNGISSQVLQSNMSTTPWPTLNQRRNQMPPQNNNRQQPMWVQNGSNWVRNSPNIPSRPQNTLVTTQNIPRRGQNTASGSKVQPMGSTSSPNMPVPNRPYSSVASVAPKRNNPNNNRNNLNVNFLNNERTNIPGGNFSSGSFKEKQENTNFNQELFNDAAGGGVSDNELREFSEALLNKDMNNAAKYVTLNVQKMTSSRSSVDEAPLPLLSTDGRALSIPTVSKLIQLYNNYILETNQNEVYTAQEKQEENDFLEEILSTPVMQYVRNFLIEKDKLGRDPKDFKDLLRTLWFNMYSRGGGRIGSSGFEHVFLAELKSNKVSGLHNWVYFQDEEKKHNANYLGYMKKLDLGNKGAILKLHFVFHGSDKPVGAMFVGTSPEFEMGLYTTCFVLRADRICPLKLNGNKFIIRTYTFRYRGKNMIGSAFPEI